MSKQDMLINYVAGEECRIAIVEKDQLEELYTERASDDIHVGNIYRGRVTNVEPSIQAAFVDFGLERNGFLHISDLHPRYFGGDGSTTERVGKRTPRRDRPPIQQCLKRGQTILVQVLKEGIGTKGPTLTSYLSIPGRFLVMMPDMERHGVSRKVEDEDQRREMRKILDELDPPDDFGFIVRTAGIGRTKTELKRDLAYLLRLWRTIERRLKTGGGPAELYRESDLVIRTLRDVLNNEIGRVIVDDPQAALRARDFLRIAMPRGAAKVYFYDRPIPLLDAFGIEQQIESINHREVPLKNGGSLVIDTTEAMVAIDVNSGKFRDKGDSESTAYATNQEAVDEIARQLRLRDLGGVLVLDLIDMYQHKHRRDIERQFRDNLKKDRARTKTLKINELGLLSMTRQRMRPSLKRSLNKVCPTCEGKGVVRTDESVVLDVMRQIAVVLSTDPVQKIEVRITPQVGATVLNRKRNALHLLEEHLGKNVQFIFDAELNPDEVQLTALDTRGAKLDIAKLPQSGEPKLDEADEVEAKLGPATAIDDNLDDEEIEETAEQTPAEPQAQRTTTKKKRRRRRGRGKKSEDKPATDEAAEPTKEAAPQPDEESETVADSGDNETNGDEEADGTKKRRRRRRGGRRHRRRRERAEAAAAAEADHATADRDKSKSSDDAEPESMPKPEPVKQSPAEPAAEDDKPTESTKKTTKKTPRRKTAKKAKTTKKVTRKKTAKATDKSEDEAES